MYCTFCVIVELRILELDRLHETIDHERTGIHPWRRNVTTSMFGLKNGHICKNLTQDGEPQRFSWRTQKKKEVLEERF